MPFANITGGGMAFCSMLGAISLRRPHRDRVSESREPAAGVSARVRTAPTAPAAAARAARGPRAVLARPLPHRRSHHRPQARADGLARLPVLRLAADDVVPHDDVAMEHCQDDVREAV